MSRLTIDQQRCQGHGRCALIAPDLFDVSDAGLGLVLTRDIDAQNASSAEEAAHSCPEQAITVHTEGA